MVSSLRNETMDRTGPLRELNYSLTVPTAPFPALTLGTLHTMTTLSLREAATATGTSKSTILRAIQSGRLSAPRTDDGGYAIDPAELFRVYQPRSSEGNDVDQAQDRGAVQDTTFHETQDVVELRVRNARLEGELSALKALLEAERKRAEELKEDRDRWHTQAERYALAGPTVAPGPAHQSQESQGVPGFLRRLGWRSKT